MYLLISSRCFTRQILPIQLAAKPGWCCRSSTDLLAPDPICIFSENFLPDQALTGMTIKSRTTSPTRDFDHAGPLPVDPIKIYSCNDCPIRIHTSHYQCPIDLVQLNLQSYNLRNGQGLPKVGYKGLSNYSNSSTVGFEPQTSCMAVWQPNHYTTIARP